MNVRRIFGTAAALALTAGGVLASSAPAQAAVNVCTYTVTSVEALDTQESTDEIWVVINGIFFKDDSVTFVRDQVRSGFVLGSPHLSSTFAASIGLVEDDQWPDGNDTLDADTVSCAADVDSLTISGSGYEYLVDYTVTVSQSP